MCGRYVITSSPEALRRLFAYVEQPNFPPRYNVAPTQPVPVVSQDHGVRHFHLMRWGLLPAWVKDPKFFGLVINARAEGVQEKPAFRNALRHRRVLLPANGYYEWQETGGRKRPFFVHPRDDEPIAFAGLAETWTGPNGEELDTVAIVTAAAHPEMTGLHARVPVTIARENHDLWLDCSAVDAESIMVLLGPPPPGVFAWHEVSTAVNRTDNDGIELILPLAHAPEPTDVAPPRRRAPARKPVDDGQGSLF